MYTLCCMSLSLASRIIATLGLSVSILMLNIVISEFFGRPRDEFFTAVEPWSFLGLNWTRFLHNSNIPNRVLVIFSCYFGYLILYLITSSLLAIGTVIRQSQFASPWLYFQIVSIADQLVTLILNLTTVPAPENAERSHWYIPLCSLYLMYTIYVWMVVYAASEEWSLNPTRSCTNLNLFEAFTADESIEINQQPRTEKSPSFLAQNHIFFEVEIPHPLPDKYDIV
ncbi:hypothetical protein PV328_005565 [Microctonus aethiopoides]|uniref:Uncharacterized protein n=1 Tax=Microctonus aethiopoides TaxID=144406 RepID=A0AA39FMD9_9HYME|nr:hypothetical protein PV328_005565 [Microctonus aethiopoides]